MSMLIYFYRIIILESINCCSLNFVSMCTEIYGLCVIPNIFFSNKFKCLVLAGIIQSIIVQHRDKVIVQFNGSDFWKWAIYRNM